MSGKVTGDEAWTILETKYPRHYVSKVPSLVAGIIVSVVILVIAAYSLKSGVQWMSSWLWIASSAIAGFVTAYLMNLYLECQHPANQAYCEARHALSMGKAIDRDPTVVGVARV